MKLCKLVAIGFAALSVSAAKAEDLSNEIRALLGKAVQGCQSEGTSGGLGSCAMKNMDTVLPEWKSNAAFANAFLKMFDFLNEASGKVGRGEWSQQVATENLKIATTRMEIEAQQALRSAEQAKAGQGSKIDTNALLLLMMMQGQQPRQQRPIVPPLQIPPTYYTNCTTDRLGNVNCTTR